MVFVIKSQHKQRVQTRVQRVATCDRCERKFGTRHITISVLTERRVSHWHCFRCRLRMREPQITKDAAPSGNSQSPR
jgi:hypothetical protein